MNLRSVIITTAFGIGFANLHISESEHEKDLREVKGEIDLLRKEVLDLENVLGKKEEDVKARSGNLIQGNNYILRAYIDCNVGHSAQGTNDELDIQVQSGSRLMRKQRLRYVTTTSTSIAGDCDVGDNNWVQIGGDFAVEFDDEARIYFRTTGGDAMIIDRIKIEFVNESNGQIEDTFTFGSNNAVGWCLSEDGSDFRRQSERYRNKCCRGVGVEIYTNGNTDEFYFDCNFYGSGGVWHSWDWSCTSENCD